MPTPIQIREKRGGVSNSVKTELDNIQEDPYALGWDAGENMDDPSPCPFLTDGPASKLWRQGFTARVNQYIARRRSAGGLAASLL